MNYDETSLSEQAMFQCAGCGLKIEHYAEVRYFDWTFQGKPGNCNVLNYLFGQDFKNHISLLRSFYNY